MRKSFNFLLAGAMLLFAVSGLRSDEDDSLASWGDLLSDATADVATNAAAVQANATAAPAPVADAGTTAPVPVAMLVSTPTAAPITPAQPVAAPKTGNQPAHKKHHHHHKPAAVPVATTNNTEQGQPDALAQSITKNKHIQGDNAVINTLVTKWQGIADQAAKEKAADAAKNAAIAAQIAAEQQELAGLQAQAAADEKKKAAEEAEKEREEAAAQAKQEAAAKAAAQQAAVFAAQRAKEQQLEAATEAEEAKEDAAKAAAQKAAQLRAQQEAAAQARARQLAQQQQQAAAAAVAQRERQVFSQPRTTPTTYVFQSIEPNCWTVAAAQNSFASPQDNNAQYFWYSPYGPVGSGDYAKLVSNEESVVFNNRSGSYSFTLGNFNRYGDEITFDVTAVKSPQLSAARPFNGIQFNVQSGGISSHSAAELDKYLGFNPNTNIADNVIVPTLKRLIPQSQKFSLPSGHEVAWVQIDHQANNTLGDAHLNQSDIFIWMLNAQSAWTRLQHVFIGNGGQYIPFATIENTDYQYKNDTHLIGYNSASVQGFFGKQWGSSTNAWRQELGYDDDNLADAVLSVLFSIANGGNHPSEKGLLAAAGGAEYNELTFKSQWEGDNLVCTDANTGASITLQFTDESNYRSNIGSNNQHINLTATSSSTGKSVKLQFYPGGLYWLLGTGDGKTTYCNANHTPTGQSGDLDTAMGYKRGAGLSVVLARILQFACPVLR